MKGTRLKTLGFALLGGLALLFAGCGQQAGGGGGQEAPKPIQVSVTGVTPNQLVSGPVDVGVSINEDSQAQEVALYLDDTLVAKYNIATQGLRPQALSYQFTVNTAACDPAFLTSNSSTSTGCSATKSTPLVTNGPHTIKAVVKNAVETKTLSVPVVFDNQDKIAFTIEGNSAQSASGQTWYGNGDVKVKAAVVSYTGATYSFAKVNATTWKITRTGGTASDDSKYLPDSNQTIGGGATLTSASGLELLFAKADNNAVQGTVSYYSSLTGGYILGTAPTLRLDNVKPSAPSLEVQRLYEENPVTAAPGTWVSKSTKLFRSGSGGTDGGVGVDPASFQVVLEYGSPTPTTVTKGNGDSLSDLPNGTYNIAVKKLVLKDKLGNTVEVTTGLPTLQFETTPPSIVFGAAPGATATAGALYALDLTGTADTGSGILDVSLAVVSGGKYYPVQTSLALGPNNWTAFKLGDGPTWNAGLAVVAFDNAGNYRVVPLNVTVYAASAADQQAPVVNSLTASGSLAAGDGTSSINLTAKASEKPTHTSGSVTFMTFFRQHSNAADFYVPVGVSSTANGSTQDSADSNNILGSSYPNPGTFGTAVLVRDGVYNAALATGTLDVQE
ncbi:hypothetical protein TthAA37_20390 [Thermus thermophilus]|uniref:hypothetical protein n=1 Tax=Thermus thermophilus TaxID=274 RepID=UPI001C76F078|nr:hypothetical protein [Thermus thermophilus]BCZ92850.1 hypothetical protein TthAA37_20390 [Thermus thermophilus]